MKTFQQFCENSGDPYIEKEKERLQARQEKIAQRNRERLEKSKDDENVVKATKIQIKKDLEDAIKKNEKNNRGIIANFIDDID